MTKKKYIGKVLDPFISPIAKIFLSRKRSGPRPLVIAHRGLPLEFPENTLPSLMSALREGADGVEFDLLFSKDNHPYVCHDSDMTAHTSNGREVVNILEMQSQEIDALKIYGDYQISSLGSTLAELGTANPKRLYIHYKVENEVGSEINHIKAVERAIRQAGLEEIAVVMVESGRIEPWISQAPRVQILQCWVGLPGEEGRYAIDDSRQFNLNHFGFYAKKPRGRGQGN
ncbi:glycerophosphodiester phosphodiesterase [Fodinicurvata halophila]|uniref:glycerophosphodiester phosphodiesterase n=1 Tax=Fodinicurvata halophila TaxID=1419723 RepID=UPI003639054D